MAELLSVEVKITDDMTTTQEADALILLSKAVVTMIASAFMRGRYSINDQKVQAALNGAAQMEGAGKAWAGPPSVVVPQPMPGRPH
jgi:hypothetical protein